MVERAERGTNWVGSGRKAASGKTNWVQGLNMALMKTSSK